MAEDGPGGFPDGGVGKQRSSLEERLAAAHRAEAERTGTAMRKPEAGYRQGSRVLTELIAGLAGGGLIGWVLDRWLNTSPWLLLVLLFLGFSVACRNIYRISNERPE
ncbi:MAG TPA: AtpZ/AtpI family protein [Sphingomonas sp.]